MRCCTRQVPSPVVSLYLVWFEFIHKQLTAWMVPPCLLLLLPQMERNIASFAEELGQAEVAAGYAQHAQRRLEAIQALLWHEGSGQWRDLVMAEREVEGSLSSDDNILIEEAAVSPAAAPAEMVCRTFQHSGVVAASNWVPLYCGCTPAGSQQADAAVAALQSSGLLQAAGVAVTLSATGQQWDWPNAWPPVTCMLLEGCQRYGGAQGSQVGAQGWRGRQRQRDRWCGLPVYSIIPIRLAALQLAGALAQQYLETAHAAWQRSGRMFEKFDATAPEGAAGGGGEYECVDGFGWTNGVALLLLENYGWQPAATAAAAAGT